MVDIETVRRVVDTQWGGEGDGQVVVVHRDSLDSVQCGQEGLVLPDSGAVCSISPQTEHTDLGAFSSMRGVCA